MSIAVLTWAWKQTLPPTDKYLLLAFADHANDEDFTCYPSLTHLSKKTGFDRSTVWKITERLISIGAITRVGLHRSGTTMYRVNSGSCLTPLVAESNQLPPATGVVAHGNQASCPGQVGVVAVGNPESSVEPSVNRHGTVSQKKTASATVNERAQKWVAPQTPKGKRQGTPEDLHLARSMFTAVRIVNPTAKEPNWPEWANDIRLIREQDQRTHEEIRTLFAWANTHHFWGANILSPRKLRAQWDALTAQRNRKPRRDARDSTDLSAPARVARAIEQRRRTRGAS